MPEALSLESNRLGASRCDATTRIDIYSVCVAILAICRAMAYLFVMTKPSRHEPGSDHVNELQHTKTPVTTPVTTPDNLKCRWCRSPLPPNSGAGRRREFCSQACRQWDWVARQRASELALSEDELVITRTERDKLRDQIFVLRCAVQDVEQDLDPSIDPTTRDYKAALSWLLDAARPLVQDPSQP